jgi:HK97 family phage major capsid protein
MVLYTTTTDVGGLLPHDFGKLVVQPAMEASILAQVATTVTTSSTEFHIPIVASDPTAAWPRASGRL